MDELKDVNDYSEYEIVEGNQRGVHCFYLKFLPTGKAFAQPFKSVKSAQKKIRELNKLHNRCVGYARAQEHTLVPWEPKVEA